MIDGPDGPGSLQDHVPEPGRFADDYTTLDRQMLGTLDYITGQTDRHELNVMTQSDGRPAAIDNGLAFPDGPGDGLRSEFLPAVFDAPLDDHVVDAVRRLSPDTLATIMRRHGCSVAAVDGALARLDEAASGFITGRAWPGRFSRLEDR
ncbi:hypothetical protein ACFQH9_06540 [Pseudonocardia lutea]|uniref:PI3K/PI4K catalytic domain-containing protein n=1 Tax=Pseudonocardia lutea TaxID=2172015 RepID=A0ABW1I553_9PSEU